MAASPTTRSSSPPNSPLDLPVRSLPGVGVDSEKLLEKLGIRTVGDLLWHLPSRHIDFSTFVPLRELRPDKEQTAQAIVGPIRERRSSKGVQITEVELLELDGTPTGVSATWFGRHRVSRACSKVLRCKVRPRTSRPIWRAK